MAFLVLFSLKSLAQSAASDSYISLGVEGASPIGDFGKGSNFGIGASAKVAKGVFPGGAVTFSAGYIGFSGKSLNNVQQPAINFIPIKAGFQYITPIGVYIEPQIGITTVLEKGFDSKSDFTYAGNIGVRVKKIDLSVRYEGLVNDVSTNAFIGFRLAYNFSF